MKKKSAKNKPPVFSKRKVRTAFAAWLVHNRISCSFLAKQVGCSWITLERYRLGAPVGRTGRWIARRIRVMYPDCPIPHLGAPHISHTPLTVEMKPVKGKRYRKKKGDEQFSHLEDYKPLPEPLVIDPDRDRWVEVDDVD